MPGSADRGKSGHRALPALVLLLATGLLLSCKTADSSSGKVTLDRLPTWRPSLDQREIKVADIVAYIHERHPNLKVRWSDNTYKRISYEWLEEYLHWTWTVNLATGVQYRSESFDCEEFSLAFYLFTARAASAAGEKAAPLVGRIVTQRNFPFAGVEASPGKTHELIVVATDRGVFVVEPQTTSPHRLVPFDQYPNPILNIVFGD